MLVEAEWLSDPATQSVFSVIAQTGHEVRAVGGCVRNSLLAMPVGDVDLATTAQPDEVMTAAGCGGLAVHPTGLQHGTVTIVANAKSFEVTTLRRDVATDGRHAEVAFTDDWQVDASRRDFTMNALYCDAGGALFDPLGGLDDLKAKRVRFIGDADCRIAEDYLRILRFFRFAAAYGDGNLDASGLGACIRGRRGLDRISGERIGAEMMKLAMAPHTVAVIRAMAETGILSDVLATPPRVKLFASLVAHAEGEADAVLRLAALALHAPDYADGLAGRLRLTGKIRDRLKAVAVRSSPAFLPCNLSQDDATWKAPYYRMGRQAFRDRVLLAVAAGEIASQVAVSRLGELDAWPVPVFPLTGGDLLAAGIPPGPTVGEKLRALEDDWVAAGFTLTREALLSRV